QIPQLRLDPSAIAAGDRFIELTQLLGHFLPRPGGVGPVEPDPAHLVAGALRAVERRQRARHAAEQRALGLLLRLDGFPVLQHLFGAAHLDVTEDVRMAAHQLLDDAADGVVGTEAALSAAELGRKHDLQRQFPELFLQVARVASVDGVHDLARLLQHVALEGGERLLTVPRAAVGREQALHHLDQAGEALAPLLGERQRLGDLERFGHRGARLPRPAGAHSAPVGRRRRPRPRLARVLVATEAFTQRAQPLPQRPADAREPFRPKNEQHHHEHDQPVRGAHRSHQKTSLPLNTGTLLGFPPPASFGPLADLPRPRPFNRLSGSVMRRLRALLVLLAVFASAVGARLPDASRVLLQHRVAQTVLAPTAPALPAATVDPSAQKKAGAAIESQLALPAPNALSIAAAGLAGTVSPPGTGALAGSARPRLQRARAPPA